MRVEPAPLPFTVSEGVGLDRALPDADRAEAADPARIAQHFALDREALLAILIDGEPRPALVECGINVFVPEVEWLQDMTVGIDDVVGARHGPSPFGCMRGNDASGYAPAARGRTPQNPSRLISLTERLPSPLPVTCG